MSRPHERISPWRLLKLIGATDLSPLAKHLLCQSVAYFGTKTMRMRPAVGSLAADMSRDTRTVRRCINEELIPRGILVAESPRKGGRVSKSRAGLTTILRLDLDALERCRRPEANSGVRPGHDEENPDDGAPEPGPLSADTRAAVRENPGDTPAKHPRDSPLNSQPTPTGGGGRRVSPAEEEDNQKALAGIVNNRARRARIASTTDPDELTATLEYAERNNLRGGWVVQVLDGDGDLPDEIAKTAERARARRAEEAARLEAARARLAALPPDRLKAVAARAGVSPEDTSAPALDALAHALDAIMREEVDAAERQSLDDIWCTLTPPELEALRCRFQCYTPGDVRASAEADPRRRAAVLKAISAMRGPARADGGPEAAA